MREHKTPQLLCATTLSFASKLQYSAAQVSTAKGIAHGRQIANHGKTPTMQPERSSSQFPQSLICLKSSTRLVRMTFSTSGCIVRRSSFFFGRQRPGKIHIESEPVQSPLGEGRIHIESEPVQSPLGDQFRPSLVIHCIAMRFSKTCRRGVLQLQGPLHNSSGNFVRCAGNTEQDPLRLFFTSLTLNSSLVHHSPHIRIGTGESNMAPRGKPGKAASTCCRLSWVVANLLPHVEQTPAEIQGARRLTSNRASS